jgi:hypothetical protein
MRHFGKIAGMRMIGRQFVRIFLTRKDPFKAMSLQNTFFHTDFIARGLLYLKATSVALHNYKVIKNKGPRTEPFIEYA